MGHYPTGSKRLSCEDLYAVVAVLIVIAKASDPSLRTGLMRHTQPEPPLNGRTAGKASEEACDVAHRSLLSRKHSTFPQGTKARGDVLRGAWLSLGGHQVSGAIQSH